MGVGPAEAGEQGAGGDRDGDGFCGGLERFGAEFVPGMVVFVGGAELGLEIGEADLRGDEVLAVLEAWLHLGKGDLALDDDFVMGLVVAGIAIEIGDFGVHG